MKNMKSWNKNICSLNTQVLNVYYCVLLYIHIYAVILYIAYEVQSSFETRQGSCRDKALTPLRHGWQRRNQFTKIHCFIFAFGFVVRKLAFSKPSIIQCDLMPRWHPAVIHVNPNSLSAFLESYVFTYIYIFELICLIESSDQDRVNKEITHDIDLILIWNPFQFLLAFSLYAIQGRFPHFPFATKTA